MNIKNKILFIDKNGDNIEVKYDSNCIKIVKNNKYEYIISLCMKIKKIILIKRLNNMLLIHTNEISNKNCSTDISNKNYYFYINQKFFNSAIKIYYKDNKNSFSVNSNLNLIQSIYNVIIFKNEDTNKLEIYNIDSFKTNDNNDFLEIEEDIFYINKAFEFCNLKELYLKYCNGLNDKFSKSIEDFLLYLDNFTLDNINIIFKESIFLEEIYYIYLHNIKTNVILVVIYDNSLKTLISFNIYDNIYSVKLDKNIVNINTKINKFYLVEGVMLNKNNKTITTIDYIQNVKQYKEQIIYNDSNNFLNFVNDILLYIGDKLEFINFKENLIKHILTIMTNFTFINFLTFILAYYINKNNYNKIQNFDSVCYYIEYLKKSDIEVDLLNNVDFEHIFKILYSSSKIKNLLKEHILNYINSNKMIFENNELIKEFFCELSAVLKEFLDIDIDEFKALNLNNFTNSNKNTVDILTLSDINNNNINYNNNIANKLLNISLNNLFIKNIETYLYNKPFAKLPIIKKNKTPLFNLYDRVTIKDTLNIYNNKIYTDFDIKISEILNEIETEGCLTNYIHVVKLSTLKYYLNKQFSCIIGNSIYNLNTLFEFSMNEIINIPLLNTKFRSELNYNYIDNEGINGDKNIIDFNQLSSYSLFDNNHIKDIVISQNYKISEIDLDIYNKRSSIYNIFSDKTAVFINWQFFNHIVSNILKLDKTKFYNYFSLNSANVNSFKNSNFLLNNIDHNKFRNWFKECYSSLEYISRGAFIMSMGLFNMLQFLNIVDYFVFFSNNNDYENIGAILGLSFELLSIDERNKGIENKEIHLNSTYNSDFDKNKLIKSLLIFISPVLNIDFIIDYQVQTAAAFGVGLLSINNIDKSYVTFINFLLIIMDKISLTTNESEEGINSIKIALGISCGLMLLNRSSDNKLLGIKNKSNYYYENIIVLLLKSLGKNTMNLRTYNNIDKDVKKIIDQNNLSKNFDSVDNTIIPLILVLGIGYLGTNNICILSNLPFPNSFKDLELYKLEFIFYLTLSKCLIIYNFEELFLLENIKSNNCNIDINKKILIKLLNKFVPSFIIKASLILSNEIDNKSYEIKLLKLNNVYLDSIIYTIYSAVLYFIGLKYSGSYINKKNKILCDTIYCLYIDIGYLFSSYSCVSTTRITNKIYLDKLNNDIKQKVKLYYDNKINLKCQAPFFDRNNNCTYSILDDVKTYSTGIRKISSSKENKNCNNNKNVKDSKVLLFKSAYETIICCISMSLSLIFSGICDQHIDINNIINISNNISNYLSPYNLIVSLSDIIKSQKNRSFTYNQYINLCLGILFINNNKQLNKISIDNNNKLSYLIISTIPNIKNANSNNYCYYFEPIRFLFKLALN